MTDAERGVPAALGPQCEACYEIVVVLWRHSSSPAQRHILAQIYTDVRGSAYIYSSAPGAENCLRKCLPQVLVNVPLSVLTVSEIYLYFWWGKISKHGALCVPVNTEFTNFQLLLSNKLLCLWVKSIYFKYIKSLASWRHRIMWMWNSLVLWSSSVRIHSWYKHQRHRVSQGWRNHLQIVSGHLEFSTNIEK